MKTLLQELKKEKKVMLYGAGKIGKLVCEYLQTEGVTVSGFIVSDKQEESVLGVCVYAFEELQDKAEITVVISISAKFSTALSEIKNRCFEAGFHQVYCPTEQMITEMRESLRKTVFNPRSTEYEMETGQKDRDFPVLFAKKTRTSFCRVIGYDTTEMVDRVLTYAKIEYYEDMYGAIEFVTEKKDFINQASEQLDPLFLYVASTHRDCMTMQDVDLSYEVPIQVGAALTDVRKGFLTDDRGQGISEKNRNYCECTALYWMWKNLHETNGYVGLEHYRRRLVLTKQQREQTVCSRKYDLIVGLPQFYTGTVYEFFTKIIPAYDWKLMKQFMIDGDAAFESIFPEYEQSHFYISCNLFVMKKEWFDRYCEWAFGIADKIEKFYEDKNIFREDRYMGYLFENMLSLFLIRHKEELCVGMTEVRWIP